MKLTSYGMREWFGGGIIAIILIAIAVLIAIEWNPTLGWSLTAFVGLLYLGLAAFFRDPDRKIPNLPEVLVSPADGVIRDIELISGTEENEKYFDGKDALRIGIFLSVLDVHLNRAPCHFEVEFEMYKPGEFHDARDPRASKTNESMLIAGTADVMDKKFPIAVKQISGAIARRIVCEAKIGRFLQKGERYGMIKFGSRTELYLPAGQEFSVEVKVGDRVFGGSTVIASLSDPNKTGLPKKEKVS
jgi:phosphatidylserine decarboxylase